MKTIIKRALAMVLLMVAVCGLAFAETPETKVVLRYSVIGSDITFRMVKGDSDDGVSVTEIDFGDISPLNHNETVYSKDYYHFVYSYSTAGVRDEINYYGGFSLSVSCSGLRLDGSGDELISVAFVRKVNPAQNMAWPDMKMTENTVSNKRYCEDFLVKLDNIKGDKLPAGLYTGVVSIRMKVV